MKLKRGMSALLTICLLVVSMSFTACSEDQVRLLKEKANNLVVYSDLSIQALQEFKGTIQLDGKFAEYEQEAEKWLGELRDATLVVIEQAKGITKFDKKSRTDLATAFSAVMKILEKLKPKIKEIVEIGIAYLNERGITNIKDPDAVVRRINFALNILTGSAKLIENKLAP
jgi:hypothetical protein